jgi:SAM-dependent methyltransferase
VRYLIIKKINKNNMVNEINKIQFQCNICGNYCQNQISNLGRENPSCLKCGSTVRIRSTIHILSLELFGESLTLPDFPKNKQIVGIGMSDWNRYAKILSEKFGYTNTFYHKSPKLDIKKISSELIGKFDFIISSDVFEHIEYPISIAFENLYKILKEEGVVIFTVPYTIETKELIEHFDELYNYKIEKNEGKSILKNITKKGEFQQFENLIFHRGVDSTLKQKLHFLLFRGCTNEILEMRLFSKQSLINYFNEAGFNKIKFYDEPFLKYGIYFKEPWSLPMSIRK